ncbi:MAG: glycosyltransferase family 4 protein [Chloroflexales bacterium]
MRLAVFINQFPGRVNTFFIRDMWALVQAGVELDIFPIYPLDPDLWQYVPQTLLKEVMAHARVHHLGLRETLRLASQCPRHAYPDLLRSSVALLASAARFGPRTMVKSAYVIPKAMAWAQQQHGSFDHILAYWGNYAATAAYFFQRLTNPDTPFSTFLHARIDLYNWQAFLREKLLYADNIFVVCEFNRQFVRQLYPDIFAQLNPKIHLYHLGLNLDEFPYTPEQRHPHTCLGVGRFDRHKGFGDLIRAAAILRERKITLEVELIGAGDAAAELQALVAELNLGDQVRFLGWLPFDQVRATMRRATMLVHASTKIGDAVPTVIKEAMALGTPVIGTRVAGIPELLDQGRCGILIPPNDAPSLANAIERLVQDAQLRQHYGQASRLFAEQTFDARTNGQYLAEVLRSTRRAAKPIG